MGGPQTATARPIADLKSALADSKTTAPELKKRVEAVRTARRAAMAEARTAQADLIELLTSRQIAALTAAGYLD